MKIGFIGGGTMGEAIVKSLLDKGLVEPGDVVVSDVSQNRRDLLKERYSIKTTADNGEAAKSADVVILAVKPQDIAKVSAGLTDLSAEQIVLSIAAGVTLDTLKQGLRHDCLVRSMPNMPAQIGEGITVWTASPEVSQKQREMIKAILSAVGEEVYVDGEKYIDMATALSGSGPAYVFLIIEALTDAGVHIGMPRNIAEKLIVETMIGSARSVKVTGKHPAELKNMVTSPGGTTAEGLLQMESGGLRSLLLRAVIAAYEKSKSLGKR